MRFFWTAFAVILTCAGVPAAAQDRALVIDQQDYRRLTDLRSDSRIASMTRALENAGFDVTVAEDATVGELRAAAFALETAAAGDTDRLLILVRGHLVSDGTQSWVIGQESAAPDRFDIGSKGLPLDIFNQALAKVAGKAVIAVVDDPRPLGNLADLSPVITDLPMPQGATFMRGSSVSIQRSLRALLADGGTSADLANVEGGAEVSGFISDKIAFSSTGGDTSEPAQDIGELAYWSAVRDIGTVEALNAYLRRYPNGVFAAEARGQIQAQINDRETQIKDAEAALRLTRDQRRSIQRDLALLGYDPRGVDGVFGPASRRAIAAWQVDQNFENHGYLDRDQLAVLREFASRRAAQLEEEARQRRQIEEARDLAFWQQTGSRGTEEGYRRYLSSFPDGMYADIARNGLQEIEDERRAELGAREFAAWEMAEEENTLESYTWFIEQFPNGEFAGVARDRIAAIEDASQEQEAARRFSAGENAVAGSTAARLLIERRLTDLGYSAGEIDGEFDRQSRRALRQFQKARKLNVTGYVNQQTMVHLLLGR